MNIILGATGQVGAAIVENLTGKGLPVRAVVRNAEKAGELKRKGAEVAIADYFDLSALTKAMKDGDLLFLLTPETVTSNDVLGDTEKLLENYHRAIAGSQIKSLIGLSSIGAQFSSGTGNLLMSNMLENKFADLNIRQVFVRPAYYYSNWMMSLDMVRESGMLPAFYPASLKFHMISPFDVAGYVADLIESGINQTGITEITGPVKYSPNDIAQCMGAFLNKEVQTYEIPEDEWAGIMKDIGFSDDATRNFIDMARLVASGKAEPEGKGQNPVLMGTTFEAYLQNYAIKSGG